MNKVYSLLGIGQRAGYIKSGETACEESIKRNKSKLVILACDASINTQKKFNTLSLHQGVTVLEFGNKDTLGHAIGKGLTAVISVNNTQFSKALINALSDVSPCK